MGHAGHQPVLRPWQSRHRGGEHDVVAVGIPAHKQLRPAGRFLGLERLQPSTIHPHLAAIFCVAEAGQPGASVGRSQRQHTVHARVSRIGAQPGPGGQAAHAVADQHGWQAGGLGHPPHRFINGFGIPINRAQHGLQIHGHMRMACSAQMSEPMQPHAPVAHQAMHQHHAPAPCRLRRQPVGRAAPPQRLAPAKNQQGRTHLMPPRPKQLRRGGQRHCIAPVEALHQHQLDSQHRRQPPQRQQRHQHRPQGLLRPPPHQTGGAV